jgi:predicted acetyltransferase
MTGRVAIDRVPPSERDLLWRLFQFYCHDMSEFTRWRPPDGVFPYRYFDAYWRESEQRAAFWAKDAGGIAGFALVRVDPGDGRREIAEFFVLAGCRKQGIGMAFARQLLAQSPGPWKLHQLAGNTRAIAFWHRVLDGFARYEEAPLVYPDGMPRVEQRFVVS